MPGVGFRGAGGVPAHLGQEFLARPWTMPPAMTRHRGPLLDLSWTCRRPAVDPGPRRRAGV